MGLTLEFLAGDQELLIAAVERADFDALYEPPACIYRSDFSLHLIPLDLDLMSQSLGEVAGVKPLALRPFLTPLVDGEEGGALAVKMAWINYVSGCAESLVGIATERWAERMKAQHPDEGIELTDAMTEAVSSLLSLCKRALAEEHEVVHVWFP